MFITLFHLRFTFTHPPYLIPHFIIPFPILFYRLRLLLFTFPILVFSLPLLPHYLLSSLVYLSTPIITASHVSTLVYAHLRTPAWLINTLPEKLNITVILPHCSVFVWSWVNTLHLRRYTMSHKFPHHRLTFFVFLKLKSEESLIRGRRTVGVHSCHYTLHSRE